MAVSIGDYHQSTTIDLWLGSRDSQWRDDVSPVVRVRPVGQSFDATIHDATRFRRTCILECT